MQELKNYNINDNQFTFYCESINTQTGFAHVVKLFKNGNFIGDYRANYYNRTWERFEYQSAMLACINKIINNKIDNTIYNYKKDNNIKRLATAKMDAIINNMLYNNGFINDLRDLYNIINK